MSHNFFDHDLQCRLLTSSVDLWFSQKRPGFDYAIGEDSYIYWDIHDALQLCAAGLPIGISWRACPICSTAIIAISYVLWNMKRSFLPSRWSSFR